MAQFNVLVLNIEEGTTKQNKTFFKFKLENTETGRVIDASWFEEHNPQAIQKGDYCIVEITAYGEYFNIKDITRDSKKKPLSMEAINKRSTDKLKEDLLNDPKQHIISRSSALASAATFLNGVKGTTTDDIINMAEVFCKYLLEGKADV